MNYLIKKPFHKSLFAFLDLSIRYVAVFKEIVVAMPPNTLIEIHKSLFAFLDLSIRYDAVFKEIVVAMPPNTLIQIIIRINLAIEAMNVFRMW